MTETSETEGLGVALAMGMLLIAVYSGVSLYDFAKEQHKIRDKVEKVLQKDAEKETSSDQSAIHIDPTSPRRAPR